MPGQMHLRIWDVEHGACAMLHHTSSDGVGGRLAMIDSGCTNAWTPSNFIRRNLNRAHLDYLLITNADQDHMSDLKGLEDAGISVGCLSRNPTYTGEQMRVIKRVSGPLTNDANWYVNACNSFNEPVTQSFEGHMGGITRRLFWNPYPTFADTNNLSLVIFIEYANFKILFPGDLEKAGWNALLQRQDFRSALQYTDVVVASHHGRESGFNPDVFNYCTPDAVVISDKPIEHETQRTVPNYRAITSDRGVPVRTTGKARHVLTTRRDGWIHFTVNDNGTYFVDTEYAG